MEFWGIEVKPGKPLMAEPEDGYMIHVSQVSIDLSKVNEDENVLVYVKYGDDKNKYLIGNLSHKFPQVSLDLFFDQEFEISHDSKTSVFLLGNQTPDDEQYPFILLSFFSYIFYYFINGDSNSCVCLSLICFCSCFFLMLHG
ncbi:hypothetical protein CARUB_v10024279mg [Capsella rubella]|uniref:Nucleoplasmin-like domain-containing protein n=1 Tax=Capsella rubella TaxID=81985 RepID=R0FYI5_9BRAS|nr:hypothetical protein CARUB_v10024279mg [Capsella rubella]